MKKTLFLIALMAGAVSGFAQGSVTFANNSGAGFLTTPGTAANGHTDRLVYYTDNTTALLGTNWVAQLYYASGANQAEGSLHIISGDTPTKFFATSQPGGAGLFNGGTKIFPDVAQGVTATLQVRVWDGSLYSTYALAADPSSLPAGPHITGKSATFNYAPPTPPSTSTAMEGLQSFTLQAAPEPSTIALGVLGAASLLIVRRRK